MKEEGPLEIRQKIAKFQNSYYDLQEDMGEMIDSMNMLLHRIETIEEFIESQGILSCPNKSVLDDPPPLSLPCHRKKVWDAWIEYNGIKNINSFDELAEVAARYKDEKIEQEKSKIQSNASNEAYSDYTNSYRVGLFKFLCDDGSYEYFTNIMDDFGEAVVAENEEDFVRWLTDWIPYAIVEE